MERGRHLNSVLTLQKLILRILFMLICSLWLLTVQLVRLINMCLCLCHGGHFQHKEFSVLMSSVLKNYSQHRANSLNIQGVCTRERLKLSMLVLLQYPFQSKKSICVCCNAICKEFLFLLHSPIFPQRPAYSRPC